MTSVKADDGMSARSSTKNAGSDWSSVVPKRVDSEDALSKEQSDAVWAKIYREASKAAASEDERRMVRAGVYVYCCKNGTSREGNYEGSIQLADGTILPAAAIPRAATRMNIRKFLRANMIESYQFFKTSRVMESEERFIAKCASFGIAPENAFATADWLTNCPLFTPAEDKAHEASFTHGIERAKRSRGGKALEDVEADRRERSLAAQGPQTEHHGATIEF